MTRARRRFLSILASWTSVVWLGASLERPEIDEAAIEERVSALREGAIEEFYASQKRIQSVGYILGTRGAAHCMDAIAPVLGASIARRNDFVQGAKKKDVEAAFGVGNQVQVFAVADGSPAARADLRRGDEILEVDGQTIKKTQHVFDRLRESRAGAPRLEVRRDGKVLGLDLPRAMGCEQGIRVRVGASSDTAEHNNRKDFWVPTGLLDIARDDDELAIVLSRQFGHFIIGSFWPDAEVEAEADRAGILLASAAGFDITKAIDVWERIAAEEPWKISVDTGRFDIPHGYLAFRLPAIREVVSEVTATSSASAASSPP